LWNEIYIEEEAEEAEEVRRRRWRRWRRFGGVSKMM
jgi:hypothetical protein